MPYSRDEVVAELTSFYEFLISMYLPDDAIKRPPPSGWPQITSEKLGFMNRNDVVIDLLRHLPYLRAGSRREPFLIYKGCVCIDYSDADLLQEKDFFIDPPNDPPRVEITKRTEPHMVTLARAHPHTAGSYIICNTKDGNLELADLIDGSSQERNVKEFFNMLKTEYRTLDVVPIDPFQLRSKHGAMSERIAQIEEVYANYGWFSRWFSKQDCAEEVKRRWNPL